MAAAGVCKNCGSDPGGSVRDPRFSPALVLVCKSCRGWMCEGDFPSLGDCYGEDYFNGTEYLNYKASAGVHRLNFQRKWALLQKFLRKSPREIRLFEIGAADGLFLDLCRSKGVGRQVGLEVSEYSRKQAAAKGLEVRDSTQPLSFLKELRPNLIVGWDVWEHLPDPGGLFAQILEFADPDAIFAFTTLDAGSGVARMRGARWRQFHPPTHLNYPTRESFQLLMRSKGLEILYQRSFGYHRSLAEYLGVFLGQSRGILNRIPWLFRVPIYLNLYDTQLVIARRTPAIS